MTTPPVSSTLETTASQPVTTASSSQPRRPSADLANSLQKLAQEPAFLPRSALQQVQPLAAAVATEEEEDNDTSEMYIPGLMSTSLFVLLPAVDTMTALSEKYLAPNHRPPRDLTGDWKGRSLEQLINARSWRAVAEYCHDEIMASSAEKTSYLLGHWCLRLQALLRLGLFDHLATELAALFALLPPSSYRASLQSIPPSAEEPPFHPAVPFELFVLLAALPGLRGDPDTSIEELTELLKACKHEMWSQAPETPRRAMWRTRAEQVAAVLSAMLAQIRTPTSITSLIAGAESSSPPPGVREALLRVHISTGNLLSVAPLVKDVSSARVSQPVSPEGKEQLNALALSHVGRGEWAAAERLYRSLFESYAHDVEVANNLAVVCLFQCNIDEATQILRDVLSRYPSAYATETVLFNLATLLELRVENSTPGKIDLLRGALQHGGEGLHGGAVKLTM